MLGLSLSSCCRYHPAEVGQPCQSAFGRPCCLRPRVAGSAFGIHCRGHLCVHSRYGPMTRNLPKGDLVDRLQKFGFPPPGYPSYGAPDSFPGGICLPLNRPALAGHTTGRADFPHPALGRDHAFAHGKLAVRGTRRVSPYSCQSRSSGKRTYFPNCTLCLRQSHWRSRRVACWSIAA